MAQVELDRGPGAAGGLLERGAELAWLSGMVKAIEAGGAGHVVLLGGEAGVGKTALVDALRAAHPELTIAARRVRAAVRAAAARPAARSDRCGRSSTGCAAVR